MRRRERKIREKETLLAMLKWTPVGRIATINRKGYPVIKPVNFLYRDQKLYIHASLRGEKMEDIRRGSPVCFELDDPIAYGSSPGPACMAGYYYRSLIIKGRATSLKEKEKKWKVLEGLMEKYQPEAGYGPISEKVMEKTAIIEISIEEMTGKERLG